MQFIRRLALSLVLVLAPFSAFAVVIDFNGGSGGSAVDDDYAGLGIVFEDVYYSTCYSNYPNAAWAAGESSTCYNDVLDQQVAGYFLGTTDYLAADIIFPDGDTYTTLDVFDSAGALLDSVTVGPAVQAISVSASGIASFAFNWSGEYPSHDDVIGIDNLTFNAVSVPGPATWLVFSLGLIAFAGHRRR